MKDCVPDFNVTESNFSRPKKLATSNDEDVMELTWHNGQVVVQRSSKKPVTELVVDPDIRPANEQQQHLFMQEDEMASWLQYPLDDDRDFYGEMLFSAPPPEISPRSRNFAHLSRPRDEEIPASSTIVESNVTPVTVKPDNRATECVVSANFSRKRKNKVADDSQSQSEDIEFEAVEAKKQAPSSSSAKRSRAAQVHNLSERRRRDRINEKMKALQELIPRCNKSDKASMLDEAIEYLKSLQLQIQMMSMGYGMMPMMYPGMQQYMPAMGMGMSMNRPILPYPTMVQGTGIPNPAAAATAAHMGPRFPMPAFQLPPVRLPDPARIQIPNQSDFAPNSFASLNPNLPQMPNFVDPYQQFLGLQQAQLALQHNQLAGRSNADNPSTRKEAGNPEHQQTGRM